MQLDPNTIALLNQLGFGAIELVGTDPVFEEAASSKTLVLRDTPEGWKFSVKFVPPTVRERSTK